MQGVEPRLYRLDNVLGAAPWLNRKPVIVVESKACVEPRSRRIAAPVCSASSEEMRPNAGAARSRQPAAFFPVRRRGLQVSMLLSGAYRDIRRFIHALETAPEFVVIEEIVLSQGDETEAGEVLSLVLSTYYRDDDHAQRVEP